MADVEALLDRPLLGLAVLVEDLDMALFEGDEDRGVMA